ncbi:MAG: leucine-rich repeat domain-containing protein [Lachnospiraceae bacterium]|nr:leucine-rich repeat domain-containing protein [Lachnospiraceae bacterium]
MRRGTKIGWLLVAVSLILSVWVISSQSSNATTLDGGFEVSDVDPTVLQGYTGPGGAITIPSSITSINAAVFANNTSITSVTMPDTVTSMGSGVFQGCSNLSSVILSGGLTAIPDNTFRECTSLSSVSVPGGVTSIGSKAFYETPISSISIPAATTSIASDAFQQAKNLTSINIAGGSSAYSSSDGCVYNASGSRLLIVPEGKTGVTISAGTTTIGSGAFRDCTNIASLSLPNSVTTIESNAFSGSGIGTITIPAATTSIATQSGWTPSSIYGYANSQAETYAMDNGIPFFVIGGDEDDGGDNGGENGNNNGGENGNNGGENGNNNGGENGNNNGGENGNNGGENGNNNGGGAVVNPGNGAGGQASGGNQGAGVATGTANGTSNGAGGHTLDNTPTTADGIDTRYFLCIAIFAGGVGVIMYSRFGKMKYLSEKKK